MQLFTGFDAQFAQFFGAANEVAPAGNQAAIGRLKLGLCLTERFIDAVHAFDKADKFVIEFAAGLGNGQRVLVLLLVAPDIGNGAQFLALKTTGEVRDRANAIAAPATIAATVLAAEYSS